MEAIHKKCYSVYGYIRKFQWSILVPLHQTSLAGWWEECLWPADVTRLFWCWNKFQHEKYPTKGITPISTVLRVTTEIVTTYTVDVASCGMGVPYRIAPHSFYKNSHSHSIFLPLSQGHQQSQAGLGRSQIVSLALALSMAMCKYSQCPAFT